jgi:uncharacterized protein with PIN domain
MLGRLCRWLRVLGVDAEFVERRTAVDEAAFAAAVFQRTLKEVRGRGGWVGGLQRE